MRKGCQTQWRANGLWTIWEDSVAADFRLCRENTGFSKEGITATPWCGAKGRGWRQEFVWLCLDVQRNKAGSPAGNGVHPPCLQETMCCWGKSGTGILCTADSLSTPASEGWSPQSTRTLIFHRESSCCPATHLVQRWEGRRGKRRRYRTTQSYLPARLVKNPPAVRETRLWSLGQEDPLEKGMATHSSILGLPWWFSW